MAERRQSNGGKRGSGRMGRGEGRGGGARESTMSTE